MIIPLIDRLYQFLLPVSLRSDPHKGHERLVSLLRLADNHTALARLFAILGHMTIPDDPVIVGGVTLPNPFILSAGLVKGDGFASEDDALRAVHTGQNIIPGWHSMSQLVGTVEFGSFTRFPRLGNTGRVLWRDVPTRSTQNRIGLRNPGAVAAAEFLAMHRDALPQCFGINIAVSPGVDDIQQEETEVLEAARAFTSREIMPAWFTLNLSCPNTEDDPRGNQTEDKALTLCAALTDHLGDVPLWVKVGPALSTEQYDALMKAFVQTGVRAVIATNTLPAPTPEGDATAGIGGGRLYAEALWAVGSLAEARARHDAPVDIVGCGGVMDGATYRAYRDLGAAAVEYYSALIYRSPLAAAIINREAQHINKG